MSTQPPVIAPYAEQRRATARLRRQVERELALRPQARRCYLSHTAINLLASVDDLPDLLVHLRRAATKAAVDALDELATVLAGRWCLTGSDLANLRDAVSAARASLRGQVTTRSAW